MISLKLVHLLKDWITLIHYKNDVNTKNCFQNGCRPPSWICENFYFWSHDLYLHVIRHLHSEFHVNRPRRCRDIAKKRFSIWRPSAILNLKNFDFCQIAILGMEICRRKAVHLCIIMSPGKMIFAVLELWLSPLQWVLNW